MDRPEKVATPAEAATVVVPERVPDPGLAPKPTVTSAVEPVRLSKASRIRTVTAGVMEAPATVLVGCWPKTTLAGSAEVMLKVEEVAPANPPPAEAASV